MYGVSTPRAPVCSREAGAAEEGEEERCWREHFGAFARITLRAIADSGALGNG